MNEITLRDHFAAAALASMRCESTNPPGCMAYDAYAIADAMLAERERRLENKESDTV